MTYTALTDRLVKEKAEAGDAKAHAELVRRGLAGCPVMVKQSRRFVRSVDKAEPWQGETYVPSPMVSR